MELTNLKAQIRSGNLRNWYVLCGPEVKVMDIYINQIAKVRNAEVQRLDSITDLMRKLNSRSFIRNAQILVLRDCKEFLSDDKIKARITQNKTISDYIIIFVYSQIDKRTKFYKEHKDDIVEFDPLKMPILVKYIRKQIDLSERSATTLAEICEQDYSRILLEVDKIKTYMTATNTSKADEALDHLMADGTIYIPPQDAVFDFVDAVLKYKPKLAFKLLQDSYDYGEATMVLLANLYNSTKQLIQVQSYKGDNLASATGLTPFQIKLAKGRLNYYRIGDLVYFLRCIRAAEKGIKTGEIEEQMAVVYALVKLWGY